MTNEEIANEMKELDRKIKSIEQILSKQLDGEYYSSKGAHRGYLRKIQAMKAVLKI